jgi:hypothetical protein
VPQRAPQPVQPPDDDDISGSGVIKQLNQSGPIIDGTGRTVSEHPGATSLRQRIQLQGLILI